ncbi:MAG: SirB2 family protein [Gammaproteobacteria bacterium]|nr:SirB2 family protein [Gammaproteobacteria bacterium]
MEYYQIIKQIHLIAAILSVSGFCLRSYWMLTDNKLLFSKPSKVMPHLIDTILLSAAIYMLIASGVNPFTIKWLLLKIILLLLYIVFGSFALKRGKTRQRRIVFLCLALLSISGIFTLAILKPY